MCNHTNQILVFAGRSLESREHVYVCVDCGEFEVFVKKEGISHIIRFTLNSQELINAASKYYRNIHRSAAKEEV